MGSGYWSFGNQPGQGHLPGTCFRLLRYLGGRWQGAAPRQPSARSPVRS